jgi:hypothetical protein
MFIEKEREGKFLQERKRERERENRREFSNEESEKELFLNCRKLPIELCCVINFQLFFI